MTVLGIGIDIEDISRFSKLPFNKNKAFYQKIFTKEEIEYCLGKENPSQSFAVRFCAKEAFIKANNKEIVDYRKVNVLHNNGKPYIEWAGVNVSLSLAHDRDKAIAVVIIEENGT